MSRKPHLTGTGPLLRSTFVKAPNENGDHLLENFRELDSSKVEFDNDEERAVWAWIKDFVYQHRQVPVYDTVRDQFVRTGAKSVVDHLEFVSLSPLLTRGNFHVHLESVLEDRRKRVVHDALIDAGRILNESMTIKGEKGTPDRVLRGPVDAMRYVMDKAHDVVTPATGVRLSGDVTADGADFMEEYERIKLDPLAGIGNFTGLKQMDDGLKGAKRNELWIHAAFTGHLKSTLMMNWAYNQAVYFRHDVVIFSLEMPYNQCRRIIYAMHSAHPKFKLIHKPVDYQKIRDGQLAPDEEAFLRDHVVPDFNDKVANPYGSIHIEIADPDKSDFTVADIRARAEVLYAKYPLSMIFVDHALLVSPRRWVNSTTDRLNEVIRDCKRLAMSFNRGAGIAVVLLFQISREGFKAATKAREGGTNHVYNLTFLSYANEAERSADIVTASWIDQDLAKSNQVLYQCLKSRDQQPFDPFRASIHWPTRRLLTLLDVPGEMGSKAAASLDASDIPEGVET